MKNPLVSQLTMLDCKSAQRAKDWLNSEEYHEPRKMRHRTARANMILIEGFAVP